MKYRLFSLIYIFVSLALTQPAEAQNEFSGGSGGGSTSLLLSIALEDPVYSVLYGGGSGSGDTRKYFITAFENPSLKGLYNGGAGRGDIAFTQWTPLFNSANSSLYRGGNGRGDTITTFFAVMKNATGSELYKGGKGRGDISYVLNESLKTGAAAAIYTGGKGRGDISEQTMAPLQHAVSPVYAGGPGRGDHSLFFETTLVDVSNQRKLVVEVEEAKENFRVQVRPNPTLNYFNLVINSTGEKDIRIRITDISGKVMEARKLSPGSQFIQIGDSWHNGIYFLEVINGEERKVLRLLKMR